MSWRTLALLTLVGCAVTVSAGQGPSRYVPDIPMNHWMYEDLGQFERGRQLEAWSPMFGSGPSKTRGQFAARILYGFERLVVLGGTIAEDVREVSQSPVGTKITRVRRDLAKCLEITKYASRWREPIHRLTKEFAPELRAESINVDELVRRSDELISACEAFSLPVESVHNVAQIGLPGGSLSAASPYPDLPDNHWAIENVLHFKFDGLTEDWHPYGFDRAERIATRCDVADRAHYVYLQIMSLAKDIKAGSKFWIGSPSPAQYDGTVAECNLLVAKHASTWLPRINRLISEFAPELRAISIDVAEMRRNLNAALDLCQRFALQASGPVTGQFSDVPEAHWASQSTLDLRRAGILLGYPDGVFGG